MAQKKTYICLLGAIDERIMKGCRFMGYLLAATAATAPGVSQTGSTAQNADYTMLFCIISLLVCIVLPVGTILVAKLKYNGSLKQVLWGIPWFLVFSVLLPAVICSIFMPSYLDQEATSFEGTLITVIRITCGCVGLFLLTLFTRKRRGIGDALNLGIGYCMLECLYIAFLMTAYMVVMTSDDVDKIYAVREMRIFVQENNLVSGQEWRFIMKGLTAAVFCALQLSSAVVMSVAVHKKMYWMSLFVLAFGLAVRLPNRMHSFDAWFWGNYAVIIPYQIIVTVIICVISYMIWKKNKEEGIA